MLKEEGYSTHLVLKWLLLFRTRLPSFKLNNFLTFLLKIGKWHLGYCHPDYLPTRRGFDTFFGLFPLFWFQLSSFFNFFLHFFKSLFLFILHFLIFFHVCPSLFQIDLCFSFIFSNLFSCFSFIFSNLFHVSHFFLIISILHPIQMHYVRSVRANVRPLHKGARRKQTHW